MIWETVANEHKHEAVTESTLNVIATIARSLTPKMIEYFIERIDNLPLNMFGEYINILKDFFLNSFANFREVHGRSRAEKDMAKMVNLERLWAAVQDEAELSNKNKLITLDVLIDLMQTFDLGNTSEYLVKAVENLKSGKSAIK